MAQFTLHAYDADVWVERFLGLNQTEEGMNSDVRYATEAVNVETPKGVLQPHAGYELLGGEPDNFPRIETLASFHRRWYSGNGSKEWMVCCAGGKFYYKQVGSDVPWFQIKMPTGVTAYTSSAWSWVTYQEPQGNSYPIDIILLSNAQDGMIKIVPPDRPKSWNEIKEKTWTQVKAMTWEGVLTSEWSIVTVNTQGKDFGVIGRYAERIWGAAIPDDPDMLMYSRPYDPLDWTAAGNAEQPEDGAGDIQQPSWDGDSFSSLVTFGDQLLAFKKHKVWRVMGTNPGEYTFTEQYGGGAPYPNTVVVDVERVIMADTEGLAMYDGMSVTPLMKDQFRDVWKTVNKAAMDQMCAALYKNRYYLAFPINDSTTNNAMIILDLDEKTILYYEDLNIESFLATDDALYATSSTIPGKVLVLKYDSWNEGKTSGSATKWVSPWMDFGYKRIQKGGFDLYFVPEVQSEAVTLRISIQTEKKTKTKEYTVNPLTEEQRTAGKEHRYKKLHFGGTGRKFRIIIESDESTKPWRILGGLQLVVETDPD
jgi:hypothetical protein